MSSTLNDAATPSTFGGERSALFGRSEPVLSAHEAQCVLGPNAPPRRALSQGTRVPGAVLVVCVRLRNQSQDGFGTVRPRR